MKKTKIYNIKRILSLALIISLMWGMTGVTGNAAGASAIEIKETSVDVDLGVVTNVELTYQASEGAAALGVVVADNSMVAAAVSDSGNGKATLVLSGLQIGTTVVAVYEASNPNVVDHVTVKSGLAEKGEAYTLNEGNTFSTVYDDLVVTYNSVLNGQNGAGIAVSKLEMERHSGLDGLIVEGKLTDGTSSSAGLISFYSNFYNASGELLSRQPYFLANMGAGSGVELIWYVPKGCSKIVIE